MAGAVIGALRVDLGLDTAAFEAGISRAQKQMQAMGQRMQRVGTQMAAVGTGMTVAITGPLVALGVAASKAATEARSAMAQVEASLNSMGAASGKTKEELAGLAEGIMSRSLFDDDEILKSVTANLLTFGRVSGEVFDRAQQVIADYSAKTGRDLLGSTMLIGKALQDPVKGMTQLGRAGVILTEEQKALIKSLTEVGNIAGAQAIILAELETQYKGSAQAARDADPMAALMLQIGEAMETVGAVINRVLPPVVAFVGKLLAAFQGLSPQMQTVIVVVAAVAAAIGPLLIVFGALVASVGAIMSAFAAGGLLAVLAPLLPVIAGVTAAVAALVVGFLVFKDKIMPVLNALWATAQETLGPPLQELFAAVAEFAGALAAAFKQFLESDIGKTLIAVSATMNRILGGVVIEILKTLMRVAGEVVGLIATGFRALSALLRGDFSGAWNILKEGAGKALSGIVDAFGDLATKAVDFMGKLVNGVAVWMGRKLYDLVVKPVKKHLEDVGGFFFNLYDAVVGHSYIPDMVEGVAKWMARLDAGMVVPARNATEAAAEQFQKLRDDVAVIMDGLLSDSERAARDLNAKLATIRAAVADPRQGVSAELGARLEYVVAAEGMTLPERVSITPLEINQDLKEAFEGGANAARDKLNQAADEFADRFSRGIEAALNGDIRGVFESIFGDMRSLITDLGRALFQMMNSGGGSGGGFNLASIGSAISSALGGLPKFADGGTIKAGGSGGIDSQLVAFWKSPGEQVDIHTPGNDRGSGRGPISFDLRGAVMTADLVAQMEGLANASGGAAYHGARQAVPAEMAQASRYRRGGR